ncbi:MAG: hypothetical protein K8U03_26955 [Planctomycetia bacterium]|nr:hypothetical protein [Planctomycetia bacterium]
MSVSTSSRVCFVGVRHKVAGLFVAVSCSLAFTSSASAACPFCNAVEPSFAERRAACAALVLGEAVADEQPAKSALRTFVVRQTIQGAEALGKVERISCSAPDVAAGGLALLLGSRVKSPAGWAWDAIGVEEAALVYYLRAPAVSKPAAERLPYFAKYLEHADSQVAEDAFWEFGRAPFDAVAATESTLPYERLRRALTDVNVPGRRKGFYGLALGLARDETERTANRRLLDELVRAEANDFRAGFDGILAGFLLAEGTAALDLIDTRFLANPQAGEGDVRHAQAALRFYLQYGRAIPAERLLRSVVLLLDRPATAPEALGDLTRHQAWNHIERAMKLFVDSPGDDPALDRAVVGYLLVDPLPAAKPALRKLKSGYPKRSEEALHHWSTLGVGERS